MATLTLDHAVYGGRDHDRLVDRFAAAGFDVEFGGVHSHGTTQMSVVGFPDGSYLELIGPAEDVAPEAADFWPDALAGDAGPTAWAALVDDVTESVVRHVRAGVPVDGPHASGRERTDGTTIEWEMAFVGAGDDREAYPFLIADRTPRRYRVPPARESAADPIAGVADVVLAVEDTGAWADRLARLHGFPTPIAFDHDDVGGDLYGFPGQPVTLADVGDRASSADGARGDDSAGDGDAGEAPAIRDGLGPGPSAYLLGTTDVDAASDSYDLTDAEPWCGRRLAWVSGMEGEVGVIEPPDDGVASAGPEARSDR